MRICLEMRNDSQLWIIGYNDENRERVRVGPYNATEYGAAIVRFVQMFEDEGNAIVDHAEMVEAIDEHFYGESNAS